MAHPISRGLAAGAVGTTVLNAATYLDMALSGRSASSAPADTVLALAEHLDVDLDTSGSRPEAYGALAGMATGVGVGVAASLLRSAGLRLPRLAEAAVVGAAAMAATDVPMARLGVSDPADWESGDWVRDAVPHLAYGVGVSWALRRLERRPTPALTTPVTPGRPRWLVARGFALGLATGARSSMGLVIPAMRRGTVPAVATVSGLVAAELTADKLPGTPSRLEPGPAGIRLVLGAAGARSLARHHGAPTRAVTVAGALGAGLGSLAGFAFRDAGAERGWTWQTAVLEDGLALGLTSWAWRS